MKRLISGVLLLAMLVSLFAGCGGNETAPETTGAPIAQTETDANLADAVAYVKTVYKEVTEITAADYQRIGVVPMGATGYEIEWTVDVSEDLVKIVKNADGMVTIDVNEESEEEVPYVLTATLTGTDGVKESLSWNHILPKAVGDDMGAIVDMAYALEDGQALTFEATLTGTITAINTAWSDEYQNITVTILIEGREDKPIMCYRLAGEGAKDLAVGDLITVTGILKNYKDTIEFDSGCTLDKVEAGAGTVAEGPTDPAEIIAAAYALNQGESLPYSATLTGKIIRVDTKWSSQYKNITVTIVADGFADKPIMCFRLKGDGAEDLCVEDTITVNGILKNYYGTIEFDAGCTLVDVVAGPRTPITFPEQPKDTLKIMQDAYKLTHGHYLPYNVILTGLVTEVNTPWSNKYGNITVTIVIPGAEEYPLVCYRMVGKQYGADTIEVGDTITVHGSVTNYNGTIELDAGCWCYEVVKGEGSGATNDSQFAKDLEAAAQLGDNEKLAYTSTITGTITSNPYESSYTAGTYSFWVKDADGNSVQCYYVPVEGGVPAKGDTVTVTGYLSAYDGRGQFYEDNAVATLAEKAETEPEETTPPTAADPAADSTLTIVEAIALGESKDSGEYTEGKYYVTGTITEVYKEDYGNMYIKDDSGNILTIYGSYSEDGKTGYKGLKNKPVAGDTITIYGVIGQYNGTAQMKNGWIKGAVAPDPEDPDGTVLTIAQAIEKGKAKEHNTYTTTKYKVTGVVSEVTDTKYGNMKITDGAGNTLTIYGSYDANGDKRYDKMEKQPVAGDTVTLYGVIGQYNGTPQMKNGWIIGHTSALPESGGSTESGESTETTASTTAATTSATTQETTQETAGSSKPETLAEQIEEAKLLANGEYLEYESTITGEITSTVAAGDSGAYKFTVTDDLGNSILCFYVVPTGFTPEPGDNITVKGYLTAYNSAAQFDQSATVTLNEKGQITLTSEQQALKDAMEEAKDLNNGEYLDSEITVTGKIVSTPYASSYTEGQYKFNLSDGYNTISCYYVTVTNGTPEYGNTITVTGKLSAHNGSPQFTSAATATISE